MTQADELPDTERPPPEEKLGEALDLIADILSDFRKDLVGGFDQLHRSMALGLGGLRSQQERDYSRVTKLDEQTTKHLRDIDGKLSQILEILEATRTLPQISEAKDENEPVQQ